MFLQVRVEREEKEGRVKEKEKVNKAPRSSFATTSCLPVKFIAFSLGKAGKGKLAEYGEDEATGVVEVVRNITEEIVNKIDAIDLDALAEATDGTWKNFTDEVVDKIEEEIAGQ